MNGLVIFHILDTDDSVSTTTYVQLPISLTTVNSGSILDCLKLSHDNYGIHTLFPL